MKPQPVVHEKLYRDIHYFVSRRVSNQEDVADLVQEIFLKLQKNKSQLRDQDLLVPWLYRVARNQVIDFYRKKGTPPPDLTEEVGENDDEVFVEVASWLVFFIEAMSEPDQEILKLTEIEGKTQKAAAEALGISLDAAKARHQRAKKRLRASLEKCCTYSFDSRGRVIDYEIKTDGNCCD